MAERDYPKLFIMAAVLALLPQVIQSEYYIGMLVFTAFNCLVCIGLCLLMGYAGQISIGHAAFYGLGAYSSAILTTRLSWSPWTAMLAGVILVVVVAAIVGAPSLRLKGHYLAMATLGFGAIVHIIFVAAVQWTGGPNGINNIPKFGIFGVILDSDREFNYFAWSTVLIGLFFSLNLIHSRVGRGLRAIHGSENAAGSAGVNTAAYKIRVFIISAVFSSVAGSLYASYVSFIDPGPFDVMHSVLLVTMVAVGGMHSIWGAVTGSILLSLLPEFLSSLEEYFDAVGLSYRPDYDTLIYGVILLTIMLFLPGGITQGLSGLAGRITTPFFRKQESPGGGKTPDE
jgi:branched-chain amino acid transport system permease protein